MFTSTFGKAYSDNCAPKGDGQCDGFDYDAGEDCECHCHSRWCNDLPLTISGVKAWHNEYWMLPED